jgi:ATP-dependent DNA helicase 2 subunit 2
MGKSNFVAAVSGDEKQAMSLSSFIHGLVETEQYAVARYVQKAQKPPLMVLLAPYTVQGFEALVAMELPFAEDVRNFKFPPLDKVVTVGGKKLLQHRTLPSDDLMEAMGHYVESMDLSTFSTDENG